MQVAREKTEGVGRKFSNWRIYSHIFRFSIIIIQMKKTASSAMPRPIAQAKKSTVSAGEVAPLSSGGKPHIPDGHRIFLGDCLDAMAELRDERGFREQVDLIYLDPPFNSKAEYSFIFGEENAAKSSVVAFTDAWEWKSAEPIYDNYVQSGAVGARFLKSMREMLGVSPRGRAMLSYLTMMIPRLELMRDLLAPTGSVFLHCDYSAGHYLKSAMDAVFGMENFRNDIVWCYTGPSSPKVRQFNRKHDYIFWYSKGASWTFNQDAARVPYKDPNQTLRRAFDAGRGIGAEEIEKYRERGKILEDWWTDIAVAVRSPKERLGYPTQKPLKLLRRIVEIASNPGDIVLDPFCGCGTTLAACIETKRNCVGIDLEPFAAKTIKSRLAEHYEMEVQVGHVQPKTEDDFAHLVANKRYREFQYHAINLISGGFPNPKHSGDKGVDGWVFVQRQGQQKSEAVVISVKAGGQLSPAMVRELVGVLASHTPRPLAGILVTMGEPTEGMLTAAEEAGHFYNGEVKCPRVQILPIRRLLDARYQLPGIVKVPGLAGEFHGLYAGL